METLSINQFLFQATLRAPNNGRKLVNWNRSRAALEISTRTLQNPRSLNNGRKSMTTRASSFNPITETNLTTIPHHQPFDVHSISDFIQILQLPLADLDPETAKLAIGILGPFLSAFGFLFVVRIVMSWYPKLPVGKFPYVIAYAPTEPILSPTRKVIPPLGGVDVTPVVWFGLISFLNEILVGPQGLLVLLSQHVN